MSRRVVSPPVEAFNELRQPLTDGERAVFELFDRTLDPRWEIYVQPHLNGLRPDFVLLNPDVGIGVFEVKDWNLDAMHYSVSKDRNGLPTLMATKDGVSFSIQEQNPISKVDVYRQSIYDLYCPRLKDGYGFGAITAGVIFPFADSHRVNDLLSKFSKGSDGEDFAKYQPISGINELQSGAIDKIFPEASRVSSKLMSEMHAADLRGWLVEPDFARLQREPLELDLAQKALVSVWPTSGYRRIKGPAGSGKSLILAARAALRARNGKSVLIVTFNITLWHYLKDLVVRAGIPKGGMQLIQFDHFHLFCKSAAFQAGLGNDYSALLREFDKKSKIEKQRILEIEIPALARQALETGKPGKFDTILVDEGQDYQPEWWNILRMALADGGEMLLVADVTQDVYGTGKAWTEEAMSGMGFSGGPWARLEKSYRLPSLVQARIRDFANRFLPQESADLPEPEQATLDLEATHLHWHQCSEDEGVSACVKAILAMMHQTGHGGVANADITFLCDDAKVGAEVTRELSDRHIRTVSTFGEHFGERRREKMGFFMGRAEIKATSLHSFKGWETRLLVVFISQARTEENLALIYAAVTRLKRSPDGSRLIVVCVAPELSEFGSSWAMPRRAH